MNTHTPYALLNSRQGLLLITSCLLIFTQCAKPEAPDRGPAWFTQDAVYTYDLDSAGTLKEHFLELTVRDYGERGIGIGEEVFYPSRLRPYPYRIVNLPVIELYRGAEGLFGTYSFCGFGWGNSETPYLVVPAHPQKGQVLPLYRCDEPPYGYDTVATTEETIQVPAGNFSTFSIAHFTGDHSWWDFQKGLVQYKTYLLNPDSNRVPVVLKLHSITAL